MVVWSVAGLAGVGKTALAIQAGHAAVRRGWFPGGVLFTDLHGYDEPVADLVEELADHVHRLERLRYDDGQVAPLSVDAVFALSYRRLDEVSGRIFRVMTVNPGPDVATSTIAVLADLPTPRVGYGMPRVSWRLFFLGLKFCSESILF